MVLKVESTKSSSATFPPNVPSYRSLSSSHEDCPSSHTSFSDGELARNVREGVKHRIFYLSEQLRVEKASRDENTMSYLKLISKADRHQAPHIRKAFERVNQRTSATIAHIERKLYQCHQQLKELEEGCSPTSLVLNVDSGMDSHKQPGGKILYSKLSKPDGEDSLPINVARSSTLESHLPGMQQRKFSDKKYVAQQQKLLLQKMKEELTEAKKVHASLQLSHQNLKESHMIDVRRILESLQEKKTRQSLMEEHVNDHLQRYLDEICHLKQHLACTEEKMAYLSYERAKEIWDVMETFKNRITKLETLQQATQLEMMASLRTRPKDFFFRFISLLLTLTTILLVVVSTLCSCPLPLLNSRLRIFIVFMIIGLGTLAWQKRHVISIIDWQAWVPFKWRSDLKDAKPPSARH
ncbi:testis-specific protein TEX28 isoform X1 [Rattus norvegicus]|nr:testis-specific protein TEX28 [Rattus norvegicus]XP_038956010.1 testis-specific protein TEX28 isoform X1 [Rattus norvegicus]|eukprot:NP_001178032.1 testis-specific protein TEX28 [Rattus norvegicus]